MAEEFSIAGLLSAMAERGNHAAIVAVQGTTATSLSYGELAQLTGQLAAGLRARGLAAGDTVGLWGPNSADWIIVSLAVIAAGGVIVPIDDQAADAEALAFLRDSGATWTFAATPHLLAFTAEDTHRDEALVFRLDDAPSDRGAAAALVPHWRSLLTAGAEPALPSRDPDRPLALFYTSGTTGAPKSFFLSERNVAANVNGIRASGTVRGDDRLLLPLPLHHAYPWIVGVVTSVTIGLTIVLPEGVSGPQLIAALRAANVTVLAGVPRLYAALVAGIAARANARGRLAGLLFRTLTSASRAAAQKFDWNLGRALLAPIRQQIGPHLRLLVSGGAKLDADVIWQLRALGWEVLSGYGLAETASIFTANLPHAKRVGSEGKPIAADGRVRIAEPDETGTGEIELKGDSIFGGYRNNPEANRAAFTDDGWFRTGDLGHLDADGFLYVTGRAKEVIVLAGGKNIYPEEVEAAYSRNSFIGELAVLEQGGRLVALIRPNLDAIRAAGSLQPREAVRVALATTAQSLPSFKRLSGFALVGEALPRTRLGKYRRFLLPAIYERAVKGETVSPKLSDDDRLWLRPSPRREIWALLETRYPDKGLALTTSPQLDLGFDSFEWMALAIELQERLGIRLTEDDIAASDTLRTFIERAEARRNEAGGGATAIEPAVADWLVEPGPILAALARVVYTLNALLFRTIFQLRVEGRERLPAEGPFLIAPNHVSDLDPAVLGAALPAALRSRVSWAAEHTRLFSGPLGRRFDRAMRIHPVDERRPALALDVAASALRSAGAIEVWFPEGWRSPDGRLQRFLPGIGNLILKTGVPVVPVLLIGTFAAWPRHRRWPRRVPLRVIFGTPIPAAELRAAAGEAAGPEAVAAALRSATEALARASGALDLLPADVIDPA